MDIPVHVWKAFLWDTLEEWDCRAIDNANVQLHKMISTYLLL